jgi:hypothetical protein
VPEYVLGLPHGMSSPRPWASRCTRVLEVPSPGLLLGGSTSAPPSLVSTSISSSWCHRTHNSFPKAKAYLNQRWTGCLPTMHLIVTTIAFEASLGCAILDFLKFPVVSERKHRPSFFSSSFLHSTLVNYPGGSNEQGACARSGGNNSYINYALYLSSQRENLGRISPAIVFSILPRQINPKGSIFEIHVSLSSHINSVINKSEMGVDFLMLKMLQESVWRTHLYLP